MPYANIVQKPRHTRRYTQCACGILSRSVCHLANMNASAVMKMVIYIAYILVC